MLPTFARRDRGASAPWGRLAIAGLWTCAGLALGAEPPAQPAQPDAPRPVTLGSPVPPPKFDPPPKPQDLDSFIRSISANDAAIEVIVEQGRILTVQEDIAAPGRPALIAVGDPTVLDFAVLNARQIRIIGQRIGVT